MYPFSFHAHDDARAGPTTAAPGQQRALRKSKSYAVIGQLADLVRHPAASVGSVLGGQWSSDAEDARVRDEAARRDGMAARDAQRQILYARMKEAHSYEEWHGAAAALDALEGNDAWKADSSRPHDSKSFYNPALLTHRANELDAARLECDAAKMLFLLRTTLSRTLGGMNNIRLYRHSHVGTKLLIDRYIESALATLKALLDISVAQSHPAAKRRSGDGGASNALEPRVVLEQLLAARQAFGRSALLLSGGGTFGMNHIGVVKCLWEQKLLPRILSGSSAGSIVAAVLCTKLDAEIPSMLEYMCSGDLAVFEDPEEREREGLMGPLKRFLTHGAVFESKHLIRVMRGLLGDVTFQEAYNRTRMILNICVSSASIFELPRLLNYVTAPNVIIWSAVATSCSVPLVFTASSILAKDPKTGEHIPWNGPSPSSTEQRWIDGSVDNDLPMTRLAEMFNVNHFIVSQVNPHVVPFLRSEEGAGAEGMSTDGRGTGTDNWLHTAAVLAKGELIHRMHVLTDMHILPTTLSKFRSILSQKYSGDITILPEIPYSQFPLVLQNPTPDFMMGAMDAGAKATWPKLSRIRNALIIEMALDEAVAEARGRVVFSKSQVDLRLVAFNRSMTEERPRQRRGRTSIAAWRHSSDVKLESHSREESRKESRHITQRRSRKAPGRISLPRARLANDGAASSSPANPEDDESHSDSRKHSHMFALSSSPLSSDGDSSTELDESDEEYGVLDPYNTGPKTAVPDLWPTTRHFFPSASQPTTPYNAPRFDHEKSLTLSPTLMMTPAPPVTARKSYGIAQHQSLAASTPALGKQSEPERRYKRLFHPRGSQTPTNLATPDSYPPRPSSAGHTPRPSDSVLSMTSMHAPPPGPDKRRDSRGRRTSTESAARYGEAMPLDMSGTRGMMLRKKTQHQRSLSTGLQGLTPPSAR